MFWSTTKHSLCRREIVLTVLEGDSLCRREIVPTLQFRLRLRWILISYDIFFDWSHKVWCGMWNWLDIQGVSPNNDFFHSLFLSGLQLYFFKIKYSFKVVWLATITTRKIIIWKCTNPSLIHQSFVTNTFSDST
jgi:hypothetical protein